MFGELVGVGTNVVEKVEFELQSDSRFTSADKNRRVVIDSMLARININSTQYFTSIPQVIWEQADKTDIREFLELRIDKPLSVEDVLTFQDMLERAVDDLFTRNSAMLG